MRALRTVLSAAMIVVGGVIIVRMLPYPISASFTGIVLGGAMIALGVVRLRAIYGIRRT
ncbi:MAG TPA: hypothetical protein VMB20_12110 [Candidatus Acidoferrum sp.]|nr:hypothetical protein [Candidatus Acidoferrum sp.]